VDSNTSKVPAYLEFVTKKGGQYIFDGETGTVFPVNTLMRKAIHMYATRPIEEVISVLKATYPATEVESAVGFIHRWHTQFGGLYRSEQSIAVTEHQMTTFQESDIAQFVEDGYIMQIILNLTENCILSCSYCPLSKVDPNMRDHTSAIMKVEVGIKALDVFFDILAPIAKRIPGKTVGITFYGGEPLMQFETLRTLTEYGRDHSPVPTTLHITTNGCLLTDEIGDFLVDNEFHVAISLDGTKENHDRNRRFANGGGSFNTVYANIKRFQQRHPNYNKCVLLAVYDFCTDIEANIRFFEEETLPPIMMASMVFDHNTNYYERFSVDDRDRFRQKYNELRERYLASKTKGDYVPEYLRVFIEPEFLTTVLRPRREDMRPCFLPYTCTCVPGMKISVRPNGTFDICERVSETISTGHVDTGLDYNAIKRIIAMYNSAITENCSTCVLSKQCTLCFATCDKDCAFCRTSDYCIDFYNKFGLMLRDTYTVLEEQPSAFDNISIAGLPNGLIPDEFVLHCL
jgi:uncharacterized protein